MTSHRHLSQKFFSLYPICTRKVGQFGAVHFMSELAATEEGWPVSADPGSSPVSAAEDLLFHLLDAGASPVRIG